jgi:hypothetical protein
LFRAVKSIEQWKDTDKVVLNFTEAAHPIGPIILVKGGQVKAMQNLRYTTKKRLDESKTLDDVWSLSSLKKEAGTVAAAT